jgi:hypothetical protein
VARACSDMMEEQDMTEWSPLLYRQKTLDEVQEWLCSEASDACTKKPPALPKVRCTPASAGTTAAVGGFVASAWCPVAGCCCSMLLSLSSATMCLPAACAQQPALRPCACLLPAHSSQGACRCTCLEAHGTVAYSSPLDPHHAHAGSWACCVSPSLLRLPCWPATCTTHPSYLPPTTTTLQGREPGPLHVAIPEEELGTRNMMRKLSAQGMNGQMFNTDALKNMGGMGGGGDDDDEDGEGGDGAAPFDFGAAGANGAPGADYEDDLSAEEIAAMGIQDVARDEAGKEEL